MVISFCGWQGRRATCNTICLSGGSVFDCCADFHGCCHWVLDLAKQGQTKAVNAKASDEKNRSNDPILQTALVGVLIHGAYLGSTFFAMANGLGAALAGIVSTQPLLTTALAIFLFGEKPRLIQWIGIFIGFAGVVVVISHRLGSMRR